MKKRGPGNSDLHITSIEAIHCELDFGINWIDTAAAYGIGHLEEIVARALADWAGREEI